MSAPAERLEAQEADNSDKLDAEVDFIVMACEGDMRAAIRALITFGHEQEVRLAAMRASVSHGFARGRFPAINT